MKDRSVSPALIRLFYWFTVLGLSGLLSWARGAFVDR
jgi:hypothetical protein